MDMKVVYFVGRIMSDPCHVRANSPGDDSGLQELPLRTNESNALKYAGGRAVPPVKFIPVCPLSAPAHSEAMQASVCQQHG